MEEKEENIVQPETAAAAPGPEELAVKKRFVNPEDIENEKRQYISLMNERERQKLLEQIAKEEEEERLEQGRLAKLREEKRKNSVLFRLQDKLVDKITAPKIPKFMQRRAAQEEAPPVLLIKETRTEQDYQPQEAVQEAAGAEAVPKRDTAADVTLPAGPGSLKEACARIRNDKYAFFYIEPANMEYFLAKGDAQSVLECRNIIERCGKRIWQGQFYVYEDTDAYCALMPDCRLNANALKKMGDSFLFAIKEFSVNEKYQACYGYASGRPGASIELVMREAIQNCKRQQMEENSGIDDEEEIRIKRPDEMDPEEYDSCLSIQQRAIKVEAKAKYIDDDIMIEQVLHNIKKHNTLNDPLYLIALASPDMNSLVIMEDIEDFEVLCEEEDITMIACSYIYAVSKSGGHWYGSSNATKEIHEIFNSLAAEVAGNNGRFKKELLYQVPNINIFKDIYTN